MPTWTRRAACRGLLAAPLVLRHASAFADVEPALADIERKVGGRLGVAVGGDGGLFLGHRADERFAMCSTFKALAVAAVLARVDAGAESLDRVIAFGASDLLEYAPVSRTVLEAGSGAGRMTVSEACAASLVWSDNTAANLLLTLLGGPEALTAWLRGAGDHVTRLDRTEPTLNTARPDDPRDTTTPAAMRDTLGRILLGSVLSPASRGRLEGWMVESRTGLKRLRAGLPTEWTVGDKTGSGDNGTANVVAILRPPGRAPLIAAVYLTGTTAPADVRDAAHAAVGRLIAGTVAARAP